MTTLARMQLRDALVALECAVGTLDTARSTLCGFGAQYNEEARAISIAITEAQTAILWSKAAGEALTPKGS